MRTKKFLAFIAIFLFLFSFYPHNLRAVGETPDISFNHLTGDLEFSVTATLATASIKFYTVGWNVRRDKTKEYGTVTSRNPNGLYTDIRGDTNYVTFDNEITKTGENVDGTLVTTFFNIDVEKFNKKMINAGMGELKPGDTLYLSAIMVSINGTPDNVRSGPYHELQDIKEAEPWAHPNDLDNYFEIRLDFDSPAIHPVDSYFYTTDNLTTPFKSEHIGDKYPGDAVTYTINGEPIMVYNGISYQIVKSYLVYKLEDAQTQRYVQTASDAAVLTRNFTVPLGGINVISIWQQLNPVKVKFFSNTGEAIRDVEDLGMKEYAEAVTYSFDESINYNGKTYQIAQSYFIDNTDTSTKKYVQNSGDAGLVTRHFTVPIGGTTVFGIYCSTDDTECSLPTTDPPDPTPSEPEEGEVITKEQMDPSATGVIQADDRDSEDFDVSDGIPTSEDLYVNVLAQDYLYHYTFTEMVGIKTYSVPVTRTYNLTWKEQVGTSEDGSPIYENKSDTETVTTDYDVEREYSYWEITELAVYGIDHSEVNNYALPDGGITIEPSNAYRDPTVDAEAYGGESGHITDPEIEEVDAGSKSVSGGNSRPSVPNEDLSSYAEDGVGEVQVNNDRLVFNGETIMDDAVEEKETEAPGEIPDPSEISRDILYEKDLTISPTKTNKKDAESDGTITYHLVADIGSAEQNQTFDVEDINTVTVHTPVVMYPSISDDQEHNQKIEPNSSRDALILDRPFTVTIPTEGQHDDYLGYGDRDYAKYTANKQVLFPFDVWNSSKSQYIKANTWVDIPVVQLKTNFYMPVWVDEGDYTVSFRAIAENAPDDFTYDTEANFSWQDHVAVNTVKVEVIGRLYDFRITDIGDYDWESVFRTTPGSSVHSQNVYWVGSQDIDGDAVGNRNLSGTSIGGMQALTLPVMPGSHTNAGYKNVAVKTGYHFKFDLKTKGNMFGLTDGIRITPTFYYVKADGTGRQKVDLYYSDTTAKKYFIKVGSDADEVARTVILNDKMRNVPATELANTAGYWSSEYGLGDFQQGALKKTESGRYSWLALGSRLRTFIGPVTGVPSSVDANRALASIQHWYGEYSLPADPYVVEAGFNLAEYGRTHGGLTDDSPVFLKDGYIIVNFNIETIKEADTSNPVLRYYRLDGASVPLDNQWTMEGFSRSRADAYGRTFSLKDGDVIFFDTNLSSHDDFGSSVTH